jgi:hypothetical protein
MWQTNTSEIHLQVQQILVSASFNNQEWNLFIFTHSELTILENKNLEKLCPVFVRSCHPLFIALYCLIVVLKGCIADIHLLVTEPKLSD